MALYEDEARASADVKQVAQQHLERIEAKIQDLEAVRATLSELVDSCAGDSRPDCPILKNLSGD
jgi:DNA-binding transcriptional MerR regulator